jgi:hypothetical protein
MAASSFRTKIRGGIEVMTQSGLDSFEGGGDSDSADRASTDRDLLREGLQSGARSLFTTPCYAYELQHEAMAIDRR